jgi:hypothetical protein
MEIVYVQFFFGIEKKNKKLERKSWLLMSKFNGDYPRLVLDLGFLQDSQRSERCAAKGKEGGSTTFDA